MKKAAGNLLICVCLLIPVFPIFPGGAGENPPEEKVLTVFAAASLTDVMEEASGSFLENTGIQVQLNTASTSTLARQIESGAEADLFFSANEVWMTYLSERGFIDSSDVRILARGQLVFIAPPDADFPPFRFESDFPAGELFEGRLALGDPEHVPAGMYAAEALRNLGWYVSLSPRFLPSANVRAALMAVESGEVSLGIVYATDAALSSRVKVAAVIPGELHTPVIYQGTVLKGAGDEASLFIDFLTGPEGRAVLSRLGFGLPEEP